MSQTEKNLKKEEVQKVETTPKIPYQSPREREAKAREEFRMHQEIEFERIKREEEQLVKGIFRHNEKPGGLHEFSYRKYEGPIEDYVMKDGEVYEIPLAVARHLNMNGAYPVYKSNIGGKTTKYGKRDNTPEVLEYVRRFSFTSLDFANVK